MNTEELTQFVFGSEQRIQVLESNRGAVTSRFDATDYRIDNIEQALRILRDEILQEVSDKLIQFHNEHYDDAHMMSEAEFSEAINKLLFG